jgi:hypothetical protein
VEQELEARSASKEIGAALARAGCRLLVYSSSTRYIEADVVEGFCAETKDGGGGSIQVHHQASYRGKFKQQAPGSKTSAMFVETVLQDDGWEASFYRSLKEADGVVLLGGGPSTIIAGHVALILNKPLVAMACFGGSGAKLLPYLRTSDRPPTNDEEQSMLSWSPKSAEVSVASLVRRHQENAVRKADETKRVALLEQRVADFEKTASAAKFNRIAGLFLGLYAAALAGLAFLTTTRTPGPPTTILFMGSLAVAGACGAAVRLLLDSAGLVLRSSLLGGTAGIILSILYLLPQLVGNASLPSTGVQFGFALFVAFGAGFVPEDVIDAFQKRTRQQASQAATSLSLQSTEASKAVAKPI